MAQAVWRRNVAAREVQCYNWHGVILRQACRAGSVVGRQCARPSKSWGVSQFVLCSNLFHCNSFGERVYFFFYMELGQLLLGLAWFHIYYSVIQKFHLTKQMCINAPLI